MDATTPLSVALATTPAHLKSLAELGVMKVGDLLTYFPRMHNDLSNMISIEEIEPGQEVTVAGVLRDLRTFRTRYGKLIIQAKLVSGHEPDWQFAPQLPLVWFNQAYVTRALRNGDEIVVTGRAKFGDRGGASFFVSGFEKVSGEMLHAGRIVPVYRQHGKQVTTKWLREKIFPLLKIAKKLPETLPDAVIERQDLITRGEAITQIHFPESDESKAAARQRLAFEELFFLQLSALRRKLDWQIGAAGTGVLISRDTAAEQEFLDQLPFSLTRAQQTALTEILVDLQRDTPMNRLLEGDVGSGKTVVAALAIFLAVRTGKQAALLAPTEILSAQHFRNFLKILHPLGVRAELLTGSTPAKQKREIIEKLKTGQLDLVVGTHALLEEKVQFQNLALAVIDEQHRFGVRQRALLSKNTTPHILAMTATPIPRTLALTVFGDQDVSIIDELPPGRQEIVTRLVPKQKRDDSYRWIEDQVAKGRQVFIVCPLIEESEALEVKSAKKEFKRLAEEVFPKLELGLLHGKMKPRDKDAVMADFSAGKIQILVATTVIEVGIDVPNASIMLIEAADRFGLAQLHQLRGRVGRGEHQSYCFLFSDSESEEVIGRLQAMVDHASGFRLAEIDLKLRGPGEVFGTRQSGIPDLRFAKLSDGQMIKAARDEAEEILETDPELAAHPMLSARLAELGYTAEDDEK